MKALIQILALLLCLSVLLLGCHRTTTVILPPETEPSTAESTMAVTAAPTGTTTAPVTEPTTGSTTTAATQPTDAPATEPVTGPTVPPTSAPATKPTEKPATQPTSEPMSEPTDAPATEPSAAPTDAPVTEPSTVPTVPPETTPETEPTPEPTVESTSASTQHPVYDISGHSVGSLEYELLNAINQQRAAEELPALSLDSTLCALAAIRSYECTESFSHTRPDGRGAFTVLSDYDYSIWSHVEERIHHGSAGLSTATVIKGWMRNESFSASILSDVSTHIGIGVYTTGGITYITCIFTA